MDGAVEFISGSEKKYLVKEERLFDKSQAFYEDFKQVTKEEVIYDIKK